MPPHRRPSVRHLCLALALPLLAAGSARASEGVALDWLAGHWCGEFGAARIEEHWIARGRHLLGLSATTAAGELREFEYLRIEPRDGGLVYLAQPQGRPPTAFALSEHDERRAVFANPAHDFPQRISYWRDAAGLHAEIAGPGKDGGERTLRFDFTATCGD